MIKKIFVKVKCIILYLDIVLLKSSNLENEGKRRIWIYSVGIFKNKV